MHQQEISIQPSTRDPEAESMPFLSDLHSLLENGKTALRCLSSQQHHTIKEGLNIYTETYMLRFDSHAQPRPPGHISIEPSTHAPPMQAPGSQSHDKSSSQPRREKILMVMGFAAPGDAWRPVIASMLQAAERKSHTCSEDVEIEVAIYDNRGIGRSTIPSDSKLYTTESMAKDAHQVMQALGWTTCHLVGFSMGGMIAVKVASLFPEAVRSLTLLSVTGGGWEIIPLQAKSVPHVLRAVSDKSVEGRASTDVSFHFSSRVRSRKLGQTIVHDLLVNEYIETSKSKTGGKQHPDGERGHINAVWTHQVSQKDLRTIRSGDIPIKVIHGDDDLMALPSYGVKLATRLGAPARIVEGGHFTPRENAREVGTEILATVLHGQKEMAIGRPAVSSSGPLLPQQSGAGSKYSVEIEGRREGREERGFFGNLLSCCCF